MLQDRLTNDTKHLASARIVHFIVWIADDQKINELF